MNKVEQAYRRGREEARPEVVADLQAELDRLKGEKANLITVFRRNIRMHESSPYLNGIGTAEQKAEVENYLKGLKRGLEILEFDFAALQQAGDGEGG